MHPDHSLSFPGKIAQDHLSHHIPPKIPAARSDPVTKSRTFFDVNSLVLVAVNSTADFV